MKRHPALAELSREHHTALVLARRVRRVTETEVEVGALRVEVIRFCTQALEAHFRIEEGQLFPALEQAGQAAQVARARDDHAALRAVAQQLAEGDETVLRSFGERLDAHVRFEERELFPVAEATLSEDVLLRVDHRLKN